MKLFRIHTAAAALVLAASILSLTACGAPRIAREADTAPVEPASSAAALVTLEADGKTVRFENWEGKTVSDLLSEAAVTVREGDLLTVSADQVLSQHGSQLGIDPTLDPVGRRRDSFQLRPQRFFQVCEHRPVFDQFQNGALRFSYPLVCWPFVPVFIAGHLTEETFVLFYPSQKAIDPFLRFLPALQMKKVSGQKIELHARRSLRFACCITFYLAKYMKDASLMPGTRPRFPEGFCKPCAAV